MSNIVVVPQTHTCIKLNTHIVPENVKGEDHAFYVRCPYPNVYGVCWILDEGERAIIFLLMNGNAFWLNCFLCTHRWCSIMYSIISNCLLVSSLWVVQKLIKCVSLLGNGWRQNDVICCLLCNSLVFFRSPSCTWT